MRKKLVGKEDKRKNKTNEFTVHHNANTAQKELLTPEEREFVNSFGVTAVPDKIEEEINIFNSSRVIYVDSMPISKKRDVKTAINYKDGAEGLIRWCNDFVHIPIYPEDSDMAEWVSMSKLPTNINPRTGKSSMQFWLNIQDVLRQALVMKDERFLYRLIVLCWMRGEAKSLFACLIQLWKFFNWPRQQIMLGANSKDQVKFVHFDIIRDIVINSPELLKMIGGERNIQEKEIRIVNNGHVRSIIRSISSFSGIVSNITGYTFSEIFDMKNPKFFVQLDGSIRNIPNAFGVIDSTVSSKEHILYKLYSNFVSGKTSTVYFSYRFSRKGVQEDYWNPNMDNAQLDDYRTKFPFGEFERYFLNMWNAGGLKVFSEEHFLEMVSIGADGYMFNHETLRDILVERKKAIDVMMDLQEKSKNINNATVEKTAGILKDKVELFEKRLNPVSDLYELKDSFGKPTFMTSSTLCKLGDMFNTDFSVHVGLDMADPFALKTKARSIITCIAKGLMNSRDNYFSSSMDAIAPRYIYFLLAIFDVEGKSTEKTKDILETLNIEYDGLDTLCSERYGAWDMSQWCEDRMVEFEPVHPMYNLQKEAFNHLFVVINDGRIKCPPVYVYGSKDRNIIREELLMFDHDPQTKWFGSPEKNEGSGVQDDSVFSLMWCFYGSRFTTSDKFRRRNSEQHNFGNFVQTNRLVASY